MSAPGPLLERMMRLPRVYDLAAGKRLREALGGADAQLAAFLDGEPDAAQLIEGVGGASPYLSALMTRDPDRLLRLFHSPPEEFVADALETVNALADVADEADVMARMRRAKDDCHLALALADIAGAMELRAITSALSDFADAAVSAALASLAAIDVSRGRLREDAREGRGPVPGYFVIAMGKLGSQELNYSSDIDLVVFFDRERLSEFALKDVSRTAIRMTQSLARMLEERTPEGYVARVDLRLRPDPGATAPAIATEPALRYYEALGQNWERSAYIKARVIAGDFEAGERFLHDLSPFVWRRSLDFAALEDLKSLMHQIRMVGERTPGHDVKRGRGGIRELEFYVQAQQLIYGGREPGLRRRAPLEGLGALISAGHVEPEVGDALRNSYGALREVEHRLQMIEDQQTHAVPADDAARDRVAALSGFDDLAAFDSHLAHVFDQVTDATSDFFADHDAPENRVLIDVVGDDAEASIDALRALGFAEPSVVADAVRAWRAGRIRATRNDRARRLLVRTLPSLLEAMSQTGSADFAFARFRAFFEKLPSGVQLLSLFASEPKLLSSVIAILAMSPRLGSELARQPEVIDVMLDPRFAAPLLEDEGGGLMPITPLSQPDAPFEDAINNLRRMGHESAFRIGAQVLLGRANARSAGAAYADLADAALEGAAIAASSEIERRHGEIDGEFSVIGLGKLGGRELSAKSDLDIMLVYRSRPDDVMSQGERATAAGTYFSRLTQRLIAALAAQTEEGSLYEIDMQLRPSGSKGPLAVRLSAFERYYQEEAWTWELLALTRARPVAGDSALSQELRDVIARVLTRERDAAMMARDMLDMRARVTRERRAQGLWDMKLSEGGLMDVEFAAQYLQLKHAHKDASVLHPGTLGALERLAAAGVERAGLLGDLREAARIQLDLTQVLAVSVEGAFDPEAASEQLLDLLCAAGGVDTYAALEAALTERRAAARAAFAALVRD